MRKTFQSLSLDLTTKGTLAYWCCFDTVSLHVVLSEGRNGCNVDYISTLWFTASDRLLRSPVHIVQLLDLYTATRFLKMMHYSQLETHWFQFSWMILIFLKVWVSSVDGAL